MSIDNSDIRLAAEGDNDDVPFVPRGYALTETVEHAFVSKEVHVFEEIVVSRTVAERVEQLHPTVRRTEVDVRQIVPSEPGPQHAHRADTRPDDQDE